MKLPDPRHAYVYGAYADIEGRRYLDIEAAIESLAGDGDEDDPLTPVMVWMLRVQAMAAEHDPCEWGVAKCAEEGA